MLLNKRVRKSVAWIGNSFEDLRDFPPEVRKDAGYQLHRIQVGLEAADWKPMPEIGRGVEEIRLRNESGAYRIIYLARFEDAVYALTTENNTKQKTIKSFYFHTIIKTTSLFMSLLSIF